jgi:hypothetical protein
MNTLSVSPKAIGIALALTLLSQGAYAQRANGKLLGEACNRRLEQASGFSGGVCIGLIAGALDAHDSLFSKEERLYCLDGHSVTNDDVVHLVVDWLEKNPDQATRPAGSAVIFAMRAAFPCPTAAPN